MPETCLSLIHSSCWGCECYKVIHIWYTFIYISIYQYIYIYIANIPILIYICMTCIPTRIRFSSISRFPSYRQEEVEVGLPRQRSGPLGQQSYYPRNHPKDPIRTDYSYSHVGRTVIIYIHFLEVVEKWFLDEDPWLVFFQLRQFACVQQSRCRLHQASMSLGSLGSYQIVL